MRSRNNSGKRPGSVNSNAPLAGTAPLQVSEGSAGEAILFPEKTRPSLYLWDAYVEDGRHRHTEQRPPSIATDPREGGDRDRQEGEPGGVLERHRQSRRRAGKREVDEPPAPVRQHGEAQRQRHPDQGSHVRHRHP